MARSRAHSDEDSRPSVIVLLLLLSLVLISVLAAQAYSSVRSHRAMAERVLRDYAALAADEFARRALTEVGLYGYFPAITAVREAAGATGAGSLPAPQELAARASDDTRRALALAQTSFRFHAAGGQLETAGPELLPETAAWLRATLGARGAKPLPAGRRYETRYALIGGTLQGYVVFPLEGGPGGNDTLVGFTIDRDALAIGFRRAFERGPVLPASLGAGDVTRNALSLSLSDPFGTEIFRTGAASGALRGAKVTIGPEPNGNLKDFVVAAALDPAAAQGLVIGGLPGSRLPILLALLLLTVGLVLTALYQLRRERALSRLRADFVSRVSHELRTPLTQIRMFAETLLFDRVRSEDERARSIAIIDREARRLSNLVDNVLRFSRGERGDVQLAARPHELAPLVRDLLESFRPLAEGSGASIETRIPDGAVAVVDDDALRQIVLNLLDNAVKYGPRGQAVRVGVSVESSSVRIWVDDEGPGIPAADRERIWQRFYRLEAHRSSALAGTGIGLAVVRDLVALHGGRSWVEPGERNGSRFVVEFPAAAQARGPA